MATIDDVARVIENSFGFLQSEFEFREESREKKGSQFEVRFSTDSTGIIVSYDVRESYVFVKLCRLVNGRYESEAGEIRPDSEINCFDLNDLVHLRAVQDVVPELQPDKPFPEEGIEGIVVRHAQNLRNYATDVLRGDFSVFEDLDRIVKGRARDFAIEEWGEQKARELGWSLTKPIAG
jgi:hypothetical protein